MDTWNVLVYTFSCFIGLIFVFVFALVLYIHQNHLKFAHVPGPPRDSFIFGNLPTIRKWRKERGYFLSRTFEEWSKLYGSTFVIYFLYRAVIFTVEPNSVKELLVTGHHSKPKENVHRIGFLFGERFIGSGLILEPNDKRWAKRRLVMNAAFHRKFLRNIMDKFNEVGNQFVKKLETLADGKTVVDLSKEFHRATLDVIGKVAFDKDLKTIQDDTSPFPGAISTSLKGLSTKLKNPFLERKFWKDKEFKEKVRNACILLRSSCAKWLEDRRKAITKGESVPDDILTLIVKTQATDPDVMSTDEGLDDIVTFFVAGQETTANSLTFIAFELSRRPDVLAKLQKEIEAVIGDRSDVEFEDLCKLEYMTMVIKETLRLYPPALLVFRKLNSDVVMDGYKIPKGTNVALSSFVAGRNPKLHPDPLEFRPERFQSDCEYRPSMYSFFPFSLGPRNCIGQNFAQIEAKVFLVKMLRKFEFKLVPGYELKLTEVLTLQPADGLPCIVTVRE